MDRLSAAFTGGILFLAASALPLDVHAGDPETLEAECHNQLNLGADGCRCARDRSEEVLNDKQRRLVVAMVTKNQPAAAEVRGEMTMDEITGAAEFMMETPKICGTR